MMAADRNFCWYILSDASDSHIPYTVNSLENHLLQCSGGPVDRRVGLYELHISFAEAILA